MTQDEEQILEDDYGPGLARALATANGGAAPLFSQSQSEPVIRGRNRHAQVLSPEPNSANSSSATTANGSHVVQRGARVSPSNQVQSASRESSFPRPKPVRAGQSSSAEDRSASTAIPPAPTITTVPALKKKAPKRPPGVLPKDVEAHKQRTKLQEKKENEAYSKKRHRTTVDGDKETQRAVSTLQDSSSKDGDEGQRMEVDLLPASSSRSRISSRSEIASKRYDVQHPRTEPPAPKASGTIRHDKPRAEMSIIPQASRIPSPTPPLLSIELDHHSIAPATALPLLQCENANSGTPNGVTADVIMAAAFRGLVAQAMPPVRDAPGLSQEVGLLTGSMTEHKHDIAVLRAQHTGMEKRIKEQEVFIAELQKQLATSVDDLRKERQERSATAAVIRDLQRKIEAQELRSKAEIPRDLDAIIYNKISSHMPQIRVSLDQMAMNAVLKATQSAHVSPPLQGQAPSSHSASYLQHPPPTSRADSSGDAAQVRPICQQGFLLTDDLLVSSKWIRWSHRRSSASTTSRVQSF